MGFWYPTEPDNESPRPPFWGRRKPAYHNLNNPHYRKGNWGTRKFKRRRT